MNSNEKHQTNGDLLVYFQPTNSEIEGVSSSLPLNVKGVILDDMCIWKTDEDDQVPINPWDKAYQECAKHRNMTFAEPNLEQEFIYKSKVDEETDSELEGSSSSEDPLAFDSDWPPYNYEAESKVWHLKSGFSQLEDAIQHVTSITDKVIRIGHIDTGYDPDHITFPKENIKFDLQRNYVELDNMLDARDPLGGSFPFKHPGHGTGTLGILAGKAINQLGHVGPIGLTRNIEIVPIRIAKRVALIKTEAFVRAMQHIINVHDNPETRIHIVTMSMGGVASHAWKRLINQAYDKGIFIVTAAGNNQGQKTPRTLIHPARFRRVVAACGVTHGYDPYRKLGLLNFEMQGNYGPRKHMKTAMAAFTPNLPWAKAGTIDEIRLSGGGTSSSTPQIAMAAALYYSKYFNEIENMDKGWKKVEAIRHALFSSALKKDDVNSKKGKNFTAKDFELYFGNGILQARNMLDISPDEGQLTKTKKDKVFLPFIRVFFGLETSANLEMMELEMAQLIQQDAKLQELLNDEELSFEELSKETQKLFIKHILTLEQASKTLKRELEYILRKIDL